jgi:transposase-like protein
MEKRTRFQSKTIKRYSESFKLHVLEQINNGESSHYEIRQLYGLGASTLNSWIKKYNRPELLNRKVTISMSTEIEKMKAMKKRIANLEKALAQSQLDNFMNQASFRVAAEMLGYQDEEEFKKKQKLKL